MKLYLCLFSQVTILCSFGLTREKSANEDNEVMSLTILKQYNWLQRAEGLTEQSVCLTRYPMLAAMHRFAFCRLKQDRKEVIYQFFCHSGILLSKAIFTKATFWPEIASVFSFRISQWVSVVSLLACTHLEFIVNLNQLLQLGGVFFRLDEARAETPVSRLSHYWIIRLSNRLSDALI